MSDTPNDPFEWAGEPTDDLAAMLHHGSYRWSNRLTTVLAVLLVFVGGAAAGTWYQQYTAQNSASAAISQFASLRSQFQGLRVGTGGAASSGAGGGGFSGFGGTSGANAAGGFAGGGGTAGGGSGGSATGTATVQGTVILVDAPHHKVYLKLADGTTTAVSTSSFTKALAATTLDLTTLKTGTTVSVDGTTGSDGTVAATSITLETKTK